jgi:hypothetical protein
MVEPWVQFTSFSPCVESFCKKQFIFNYSLFSQEEAFVRVINQNPVEAIITTTAIVPNQQQQQHCTPTPT